MARYQCTICGFIFDEEKEGMSFDQLDCCPACKFPRDRFVLLDDDEKSREQGDEEEPEDIEEEDYEPEYEPEEKKNMKPCREKAGRGFGHGPGGPAPHGWNDIFILNAPLSRTPILGSEEIQTETVIGPHADKPMVLAGPVYISQRYSHDLTGEIKMALARGSAMARTAIESGREGVLPEEREAAYRYILEYTPALVGVSDEVLQNSDAAEIVDPLAFEDISGREDLKNKVSELRDISGGRPIGIRITAGHIEEDLEFCAFADPDFITVEARGSAGAFTPGPDGIGLPIIYALSRARRYLDSTGSDISLIVTGGLHTPSDFAKALAMGADAVAVPAGAFRSAICPKDEMPQDEDITADFDINEVSERIAGRLNDTLEELKMFARMAGRGNVHDLSPNDLATASRDIAESTGIVHA